MTNKLIQIAKHPVSIIIFWALVSIAVIFALQTPVHYPQCPSRIEDNGIRTFSGKTFYGDNGTFRIQCEYTQAGVKTSYDERIAWARFEVIPPKPGMLVTHLITIKGGQVTNFQPNPNTTEVLPEYQGGPTTAVDISSLGKFRAAAYWLTGQKAPPTLYSLLFCNSAEINEVLDSIPYPEAKGFYSTLYGYGYTCHNWADYIFLPDKRLARISRY